VNGCAEVETEGGDSAVDTELGVDTLSDIFLNRPSAASGLLNAGTKNWEASSLRRPN
jgi:hypothetical protein